jgi:acyl-coenzyme A synthetase/AMP-(fatty) acid ligase
MQQEYGLEAGDRVLQKTPFTFDVSVWEFFWPLLTGARLVMAQPGGHQDAEYLSAKIQSSGITTIHFVPAMLNIWLESAGVENCTTLKRVICSGEALSVEAQKKFHGKLGAELHNLYGPTEASIDVTYWACRKEESREYVPIGGPIANTQVYVLDPALELVPVGVKGELYLGGVGLARGYLERPELTAEKFVPHPFSQAGGERLYRTGDEVRWRGKGELEYLGRLDQQVKLRGFRIELGEIEARLLEQEGVGEAVVVVREETAGDKRLVAYVVPDKMHADALGEPKDLVTALRAHLSEKLPEYMVPNAFVFLPSMPLTTSGKINRKALPQPDVNTSEQEYVGPRNLTEETLCRLWQEVLKMERVGIQDNFFRIGGHSLRAAQVAARMRESFKVEIPLRRMFESPTIAQLASVIDEAVQTARVDGAPSHLLPAIRRMARKTASLPVGRIG